MTHQATGLKTGQDRLLASFQIGRLDTLLPHAVTTRGVFVMNLEQVRQTVPTKMEQVTQVMMTTVIQTVEMAMELRLSIRMLLNSTMIL